MGDAPRARRTAKEAVFRHRATKLQGLAVALKSHEVYRRILLRQLGGEGVRFAQGYCATVVLVSILNPKSNDRLAACPTQEPYLLDRGRGANAMNALS